MYSIPIIRMLHSLMHDPCIFLCKTKKNENKKTKKTKESHTTFIVTCVGYHNDGYKPTMLGLYAHFSLKMIENHVNMVPNAWLTRKMMVLQASHVDLIITFAMHKYALVIHLYDMLSKYWRSKLSFLGLWG